MSDQDHTTPIEEQDSADYFKSLPPKYLKDWLLLYYFVILKKSDFEHILMSNNYEWNG